MTRRSQQQQQQQQPLLLLPDEVPTDVWAGVVLQMLDARDLRNLPHDLLRMLPPGAAFAAKRVLTPLELEWFAEQLIPVTLLAEYQVMTTNYAGVDSDGEEEFGVWIPKVSAFAVLSREEVPLRRWKVNGETHHYLTANGVVMDVDRRK